MATLIKLGIALQDHLYTPSRSESVYAESAISIETNLRHRAFSRYRSVQELVEEFLKPQVRQFAPNLVEAISAADSEVVSYWYEKSEPLRSFLARIFNDFGSQYWSLKPSAKRRQVIVDRLLKGDVCIDVTVEPLELVLALKEEKLRGQTRDPSGITTPEWTKANVAAILSLWNYNKIAPR